MGKTKIKIIDESKPQETAPKKKLGRRDHILVEKLKAELGTEETQTVDNRKIEDSTLKNPPSSILKKPSSNLHHPSSKKVRSKKYQEAVKDLDKTKSYPVTEAVDIVKKLSYSKFNGTLEAHINTVQTGIRGLVSLPFASGRKLRILAFGSTSSKDFAGLEDVYIGTDETIEEMNKGKINFDLVITTPEWMPKLAKVARILGPRGLMPNPKNGTITDPSADGLKKAVEGFMSGKTEYKTEPKAPVIHLALGKLNQPNEELSANIKTLLQTLGKTKIKQVRLSPTMGPSVKVDFASL